MGDEPYLRRKFMGAGVQAIEFELGKPDEIKELTKGYEYLYVSDPTEKNPTEKTYRRFGFDEKDRVIGVASTGEHEERRHSAGITALIIVFLGVIMPAAVIAAAVK
jgi:hypothetical protein